MTDTNYRIEALGILLNKDCLIERYYPLLEFKEILIDGLLSLGCVRKNDIAQLKDEALSEIGLPDADRIRLFRRFLTIYDPDPRKFREISQLCSDPAEQAAFSELYCLPGVKYTRASLYFLSGYRSLSDLANAACDEVINKTAAAIAANQLSCIVPLPKEVRTHIAVAKAFLT